MALTRDERDKAARAAGFCCDLHRYNTMDGQYPAHACDCVHCKVLAHIIRPELKEKDAPTCGATFTFRDTAARDAFLANFPTRKGGDVPGFYTVAPGVSLGVFCDTVTLYVRGATGVEAKRGDA